MSGLPDMLLVGATVLAAVMYAVKALAPRAWRARAGQRLAGWPRLAGWLAPGGANASGSCGGCDNCGTPAPPAGAPDGETRVPLATVGRRRN